MNQKLKAAVIGGVLLGLLSAIPFVNLPNVCCCAWAWIGAAVGVYMYVKGSQVPASVGDGAIIGALSGVIGAIINLVIGLPLSLVTGNIMLSVMASIVSKMNPDVADQFNRQIAAQQNLGILERLLAAIPTAIIGFICVIIFATIGGMLGVAIFEKRKGGVGGPPPPPGFGGPQAGAPQNYGQPGGY